VVFRAVIGKRHRQLQAAGGGDFSVCWTWLFMPSASDLMVL
jgi:hypothetical protein